MKLLHLAYQAASHELATKTFDFSPSSVADRWTAGRREMASGLDLIAHANRATSRFSYLPIDAEQAAKSAQRGALMAMEDRRVA
ncbi:DUF3734 domain-containing protein [Microvirga sp. GCM10011540]|uniref:DUF3734 domain-containing protein n=1 Tax=Microvirga sp. GCM10011540 TaxID=3317338 RepID=UPI00360C52F6